MNFRRGFETIVTVLTRLGTRRGAFSFLTAVALTFSPVLGSAQNGSVLQTPVTPMELPIEVEIELSPAGSLKQAALWKEFAEILENPNAYVCPPDDLTTPLVNESYYCTATIERRPGFGVAMPPLNIYSPGYNFLTAQPIRRRTSDGEVSWDQPGPMFDTVESCLDAGTLNCDAFNTPTELRSVIGHLVACPDNGAYQAAVVPANFCTGKPDGSLVVYNPDGNAQIPPNGTVVATAAYVGGQLLDDEGLPITELETPINEIDFLRPVTDTAGVGAPLRPYIGRSGAEVLGKAFFWDMQVGSDGVQACGSCHFHAGADNRTRNQLNPGINGGDFDYEVTSVAGSPTTNVEVIQGDFPFHERFNPDVPGDGLTAGVASRDANDVMSSMGVSQFKQFVDIPAIGSFLPAVNGVAALPPDIGTILPDPIPLMQGVRRIEPRNTPTFHGAAFNFDNFWDGRARFNFNGGSVFGPSDPTAHIFIDPGNPGPSGGGLQGATNGHVRPDLLVEDPEMAEQPVRIKFSSLASQSVGPPLSEFEMSFLGRNHAKLGKKLLQNGVTPLANQLVATDDSVLGPFSNQGGATCIALGRPTALGKPGLCETYPNLIQLAFARQYWHNNNQHLNGAPAVCTAGAVNGVLTPAGCDPFDGYVLTVAGGGSNRNNTNQFSQMEANFSFFFGQSVQMYEELTIPDHTLADQFFDANPLAGHGVGEPGDQAVLYPTLIPDLLDDGELNGTNSGTVTLVPGFGPDELFGFDLFAGANLTAGLAPGQSVGASGRDRNPQITNGIGQTIRVGSNPFTRSAKCMLCHLGPEQTDHSINISHGILKNDAEFEYPTPPFALDPTFPPTFADGLLPAPEPSGSSRTVVGLILEEEVGEGAAQDAVEVEPRNFITFDDPATPWPDHIIAQEGNFAFGDQGIYNLGLRPIAEDVSRGGDDPFGWPLSLSALTLKNIGGQDFEPCDDSGDSCVMANFDPFNIGATFEETGDGAVFPGTTYDLQSINPGFERDPIFPQMPEYMVPWLHSLPAGELHPQIDEMAGMVPNTISEPVGGPAIEFPEVLFGADFHCALYAPDVFGLGPPNFGWGPPSSPSADTRLCPQHQSGVTGNHAFPSQGTWPVPNRVLRDGAFKAPPLRNVEMTGPYFHTGSMSTLRQVVDFYFRGGDFPLTNASNRDPNINDLFNQTFSFGPTQGTFGGFNLLDMFDCDPAEPNIPLVDPVPGGCGDFSYIVGSFGDGLPDTVFLYDEYPDSNHPLTPEPVFASRGEALNDAKNAIVKFLIALTDPRVKNELAPFDHPEIFVPIDGAAPENTLGPAGLTALSGVPCAVPGPNPGPVCFRHIPATGAGGLPALGLPPVPNFLGISSTPLPGPKNDHFDP
ncbi:MAG: hypothetical protein HY647_02350 [Acidobacteria bacterium]|nr:hypothetical protein [Acidobacteriota bacterium]